MRREERGKSYSTLYYTKLLIVLIHMCCTENVYTTEYFRYELSQLMTVMSNNIKNISIKGVISLRYGITLCYYSCTGECAISCNPYSIRILFFKSTSLPCNGPWWLCLTILFSPMLTILTVEMIIWWFIFQVSRKIKSGWIGEHLDMWNPYTRNQQFTI